MGELTIKQLQELKEFYLLQEQTGLEDSKTKFWFEKDELYFETDLLSKPVKIQNWRFFLRKVLEYKEKEELYRIKIATDVPIKFEFVNPKIVRIDGH